MPGSAPQPGAATRVVFDGFGAGEYGAQGSWLVGWILHRQTLYYRGAFTGMNVLRYVDGSLGPRPEATDLTPTGLPAGLLVAFGTALIGGALNLWAVISTDNVTGKVYYWPARAGQAAAGGFGSIAITTPLQWGLQPWVGSGVDGGSSTAIYLASAYHGIYHINFNAGTTTLLAGSPQGGVIVQHGTRLIGTLPPGGTPNQIAYSSSDFTVWSGTAADGTSGGIITVGNSNPVVALVVGRQGLLIPKSAGLAGAGMGSGIDEWFLLTGVPGVNAVLRQVSWSPAPMSPFHYAVLGDGSVMLVTSDAVTGAYHPGRFTGSVGESLRYLDIAGAVPPGPMLRLREPHDWMLVPGGTSTVATPPGLLSRDGLITRHTLGRGANVNKAAVAGPGGDPIFFTDGQQGTAGNHFWQWSAYTDAPGLGTSPGMQAIPPAAQCWFALPEWFARDGSEVAVTSVLVDYATWDYAGAFDTNWGYNATFDVTLQPMAAKNSGDGTPQTQHMVQPAGNGGHGAGTFGVRRRQAFNFKDAFGNGFQITFSNMQMAAIRKVVVMLKVRPPQV